MKDVSQYATSVRKAIHLAESAYVRGIEESMEKIRASGKRFDESIRLEAFSDSNGLAGYTIYLVQRRDGPRLVWVGKTSARGKLEEGSQHLFDPRSFQQVYGETTKADAFKIWYRDTREAENWESVAPLNLRILRKLEEIARKSR